MREAGKAVNQVVRTTAFLHSGKQSLKIKTVIGKGFKKSSKRNQRSVNYFEHSIMACNYPDEYRI